MCCWLKMQMQARRSNTTSSDKYYRRCGLRNLAAAHAERGGSANRSWLCGGAGENEPQTACSPAAHTGALPPCPGVFVKSTRSVFGPAAGFDSKELQVGNGIWRVDMMNVHIMTPAWHTDVLSCAAAFATATTSATPVFIRSSFGIEQKRWGAAMTAATFA